MDKEKITSQIDEYCVEYSADGKILLSAPVGIKEYSIKPGTIIISENAFANCEQLERLTIPAGLEVISDRSFMNCKSLSRLFLPEGLRSIYSYAFSGCEDLFLFFPHSLDWVSYTAFDEAIRLALFVPYNEKDRFRNLFPRKGYYIKEYICECGLNNRTSEYVDLGLSVKWANCNLGATRPEDFGDYYAWAELSTKSEYSLSTYFIKYPGGDNSLIKMVDRKGEKVLDLSLDVANVLKGDHWRMPSENEMFELIKNCKWTWSMVNGVEGYMLTSKIEGYTDKSIFLPNAGFRYKRDINFLEGQYWTNTLNPRTFYRPKALVFCLTSHYIPNVGVYRNNGLPIRPIYD